MKFSDRLESERKRRGLKQRDMAALGGVTQSAYHNYETGTRTPSIDFIMNLSAAGVDVWFLLFGTPALDALTPDEALVLMDYRALDEQEKFKVSVAIRQIGLSSKNPLPAAHDTPAPADAAKVALEQVGVKVKGDIGSAAPPLVASPQKPSADTGSVVVIGGDSIGTNNTGTLINIGSDAGVKPPARRRTGEKKKPAK